MRQSASQRKEAALRSMAEVPSGCFASRRYILPKDNPVAVRSGNNDLPHSIVPVRRRRTGCTACDQLRIQPIDVIDAQIAEPAMGADVGCSLFVRAMAQHQAHSIALDQTPVRAFLPQHPEAEHIPEPGRTGLQILDCQDKGPGSDLYRHVRRLTSL